MRRLAKLNPMTVLDWRLDSDPAIRWQALRDMVRAPPGDVAAERALAWQGDDAQWAGGACFPARSLDWRAENQGQPWTSTLPTLQLLHDFWIGPAGGPGPPGGGPGQGPLPLAGQPFFSGEVDPCINGRTVTLGTFFDQDVDGVVARLLGEQLEDGGWNCAAENGFVRPSAT